MTLALRDMTHTVRTSPLFTFYILSTLAVAGIIGLITFDVIDLGMTHFGESSHRTHDVTYGLLFTTLAVGVVVQLRRPVEQVSGMAMALVPVAALFLAGFLADNVDAVVRFNPLRYAAAVAAVAALLHPAGRAFLRSVSVARVSRPLVGLVAIAAVPLLGSASSNIALQRTVTDGHSFVGHYGFMAAFSFTVIAVGLLAALRLDGWRLPAWVAGLVPAIVGTTSILYPDAASSFGTGWAAAAIAWGVVFIATAEAIRRARTGHLSSRRSSRRSEALIDAH